MPNCEQYQTDLEKVKNLSLVNKCHNAITREPYSIDQSLTGDGKSLALVNKGQTMISSKLFDMSHNLGSTNGFQYY